MKWGNNCFTVSIEPEFRSIEKGQEAKFALHIRLVGEAKSEKRKNIHNTLLFDVSGSTSELHVGDLSVLEAMKKAVYKIPKYAKEGDTLTVIPFSTTAHVVARNIKATDIFSIVDAIYHLIPCRNTNFYDALELGLKEQGKTQILLLTDGRVNEGRVSNIEGICKWLRRQKRKVRVNTIGFGKYSDMDGLREIAETTGGRARFALTSDDLVGALSSMLVPSDYFAASNVELKLIASKDVVVTSPTKDYDVKGDITTKRVKIDMLYPHEIRNLLFDVEVEPQEGERVEIGCLHLSYKQNGNRVETKKEISLPVKSNWKGVKEKNKKVSKFLDTVAAAEGWVTSSNFNDSFTCVCGTCVNRVELHEEETVDASSIFQEKVYGSWGYGDLRFYRGKWDDEEEFRLKMGQNRYLGS